jgi:hypothetical protein
MASKEIVPDIRFKRGDTLRRTMVLNAHAGALDLTGCTARMHLRDKMGSLLLDMTPYVTLDNAVVDPLTPWIKHAVVDVPDEFTYLTVGMHLSDLEITWSDGSRTSSRTLYVEVVKDESHD